MSHDDIVQRLIETRECELDADLLDYDLPLLTDRQAEILLRYHLTTQPAAEIAADLGVTTSRVYNAVSDAEAKLREAHETIFSLETAANVAERTSIKSDDSAEYVNQ